MVGTYSRIRYVLENLCSMLELKQVQAIITKAGFQTHIPFTAKLIFFSALSPMGNLSHAHSLFLQTSMNNSFLCNTVIRAFANSSFPLQALYIYSHMQTSNVVFDHFTYNFVLKACSRAHKFAQEYGKCDEFTIVSKGGEVHCTVLKLGFDQDPSIQNSLLYMYSQFGLVHVAQHLFDEISDRSLVSWNIMISAYDRVNNSKLADHLLESMPHKNVVSWNTVIGRYIRLGDIEGARRVFEVMPDRDVVSWNSMIAGFVSVKDYARALKLFSEMQYAEIRPTEVTLISVLGACAETGTLEMGSKIHESLKVCGHNIEGYLGNALLNMYSKCGDLSSAWEVFSGMRIKTSSCWNAMIVGLAVHGYCDEALKLFSEMECKTGTVRPNRVTFVGVLIACSHKGLLDKARWYFDRMVKQYNILPELKHYGCLVDLLSRFGLLEEAHQMIMTSPFQSRAILWRTLLGACRTQGNMELANVSFQQLDKLKSLTDGDYVLFSNICAEAERWDEVERVRSEMIDLHVPKQVGYSQIDMTECDKLS
ncbi:unnamed protein product [Sphenostylis stenocarpa]|uniref:Pentatricopeptide repeat-containing protein n=1 Tax=Sphenostylis stenocarpa TaxID=92480 RepID=A0AA86S042_9FABA|nr:unnamed protein product [Sphenostylis stenocarpa]